MGGWTRLTSRDGRTVRVEVEYPSVTLVVDGPGATRTTAGIPYPEAGYGGHELLLSPNETYLAMWLYSGQSEVGYELFELRPALRHIGGLPYVFGQGLGPVFSPDERMLVLAWSTNTGLSVEEAEIDEDGRTVSDCVVEWATLRIEELPGRVATTCQVRVRITAGFPFEGDETYHPSGIAVVGGHCVRFETEWGPVEIPLPLPDAITIQGPSSRMG